MTVATSLRARKSLHVRERYDGGNSAMEWRGRHCLAPWHGQGRAGYAFYAHLRRPDEHESSSSCPLGAGRDGASRRERRRRHHNTDRLCHCRARLREGQGAARALPLSESRFCRGLDCRRFRASRAQERPCPRERGEDEALSLSGTICLNSLLSASRQTHEVGPRGLPSAGTVPCRQVLSRHRTGP